MLQELTISNYALIASLRLSFKAGFTVVTGETGAGKSIIIGALSLLLGERASSDHVRKGADTAVIQAVFDIPDVAELKRILEDAGIDTADEILIIKREVSASGRSRAFVNGSMVTLNILQAVGDFLVDLHGQHAHQSLFQVEMHHQILDQFGHIDCGEIASVYNEVSGLQAKLKSLQKQQNDVQEKLELYQFQLNEITAIDPQPDELAELENELRILDNAEKLLDFANTGSQTLKEDSDSLIDRIDTLVRQGEPLSKVDVRLTELVDRLKSVSIELDDIESELMGYADSMDYDPGRAQQVRDRLDDLNRLARKYGGSIDAVLEKRDYLQTQLDDMENAEFELSGLEKMLAEKKQALSKIALKISKKRQKVAADLNKRVESQLTDLGMERTQFLTSVKQEEQANGWVQLNGSAYAASETGIDLVEFQVAPNLGEDPKPLVKIASGGEISRIMLALKTVLTDVDAIPTLIFDEADVGIGGRVADMVGQKMATVGQSRQIICITHLPIIAALGDTQISVEKAEAEGRTVTRTRVLSDAEREDEIARMLGGNEITPVTRTHARELLGKRASSGAQQLSLV